MLAASHSWHRLQPRQSLTFAASQTQLYIYFPSDGDHFMDNYMYFIFMSAILWITICILFHERNYLYLDTICFIS